METKLIDISTIGTDGKGSLSFFESSKDIPFEIKRIYYVHNVPEGAQRGGHAHKSLKQLLFCPFGSIEILLDDGAEKSSVVLDDPSKGLLVSDLIWRDMIWRKADSVLAVAASAFYDESDYIRNYSDFIRYIHGSFDQED